MLARVFVFLGGLLVIVLCTLLIAPFFVDWAGYRSDFEREASRIIGQPVKVEGAATARILPFPSVTFSNVVIEGPDGTPAARIESFSMDAELAPFFNGEILIFDMRVERPDVRLKLTENGGLLWRWPQSETLKNSSLKLESVNVIEGRITVERQGSEPVLLNAINGKVTAEAINGPWRADGQFTNAATTYDVQLSTAAQLPAESLRVRLSLAPRNGLYDAAFDGRISVQNEVPVYAGKLEMTALGNAQNADGKRQRLADINGEFSADIGGIRVTEAKLTAGPADKPYRADGSMALMFGEDAKFDITLKGQQVNFGDIDNNTKGDRVTLGVPLAERVAALQKLLAEIPVPAFPGKIDLTLPAVVIGDTIARNLEIVAVPSNAGWQIEHYAVELPGRTLIEGSGDLAIKDGLAFGGQMTFASKQPTGLVNWLGFTASDAIRALPNAGLSARVEFTAQRQILRDIEFRAGLTVLRGVIDRQLPDDAKEQISIQLAGENLNLDMFSSLETLAGSQSAQLAAQDVDISLFSEPVSGFGFQANSMKLTAQIESGSITINQAKFSDFSGSDIEVSGAIVTPLVPPSGSLEVTASAADPAVFIDALATRFPGQAWLKALSQRAFNANQALADSTFNTKLKFGAKGGPSANLVADYQFAGAGLQLEGQFQDLVNGEISLTGKGQAEAGETFLAAMGFPVANPLMELSTLEPIRFEASTLFKAGSLQSGSIKAVSGSDFFETELGRGANQFKLSLADAAAYTFASGYSLPGAIFGLPLNVSGEFDITGQTYRLQKLAGTLIDVPFDGQLDIVAGDRPKITGKMNADFIDRTLLDEIAFGPLATGGDDSADFLENINFPFDTDIELSVRQANGFAPLNLEQASARFLTDQNALRFSNLKANLAGGQLTGFGEVRKNGKEALIRFNGMLANADLSQVFDEGISGKSNLQIELSTAGSTIDALEASLVGSGVIDTSNALLRGLNATGFNAFIAETDSRQNAPDAIALLELVDRQFMVGETELPPHRAAFTIAAGVARAPKSFLDIAGGKLAVEPKIHLNSGQAEINAELVFKTEEGLSTGVEPALSFSLNGPWNDLESVIDVQTIQGYLGERAVTREELRVEAIQSALLEKQQLRRENRYYASLIEARGKAEELRLAQIEQLAKEAALAEQEKLEKERIEANRLANEKQKSRDLPAVPKATLPADDGQLPLNLDGLIKQLETQQLPQR